MLTDTMHALWLSYQKLNPDMRRCMAYCSIFPKASKLRMVELVRMWIAQGFVKTSCATEEMEDVAEGYIQELVLCSFLQPIGSSSDNDCFTIHDVLHDLLDKVSTNCFRIENARSNREGWEGDVPRDVQHLFIRYYDGELIPQKNLALQNLLTLIIDVEMDTPFGEKVIESICKNMPKLRVLVAAFSQKTDRFSGNREASFCIPESISELKQLRYLAFKTSRSCTVILPSTLNKLQHIQLLDFGDGKILKFTLANLITLRHIVPSCREFPNIGHLISLQTMTEFRVSSEQGYELQQLRNLNNLRGRLRIYGVENVKNKEEALAANLAAKERLTELTLFWAYTGHSPEVQEEVLENLCPPVGLQKLNIKGYQGSRYPSWMIGRQNGGPGNLQELCLWGGLHLTGPAPAFAEAFPHLRVLNLSNCGWDTLPSNMNQLTSLRKMAIRGCYHIRLLPTMPLSLEEFVIFGCSPELVKSCRTVGHPNWQNIEHIPMKSIPRLPSKTVIASLFSVFVNIASVYNWRSGTNYAYPFARDSRPPEDVLAFIRRAFKHGNTVVTFATLMGVFTC